MEKYRDIYSPTGEIRATPVEEFSSKMVFERKWKDQSGNVIWIKDKVHTELWKDHMESEGYIYGTDIRKMEKKEDGE